jgi:nucleotide-binding universal stress UspA family protein
MRVLIAYDGSVSSDEVCDLIVAIAWPSGSELRVVTACAPYLPGSFAPDELFDPATPETVFEAEREAAEARAKVAAERIGRPTTTVTWAAINGRPASVVLDEATAWSADLVVVGTRGLGPFTAALLGSVSDEIVDHATCPVLVVRRPSIERVVLADDGSASARTATAVLAWPIFARSRVRVVTVSEAVAHDIGAPGPGRVETAQDDRRKMVEAGLAAVRALARSSADRLAAAGLTTEIDVRHGDPAHEIIRAATDWAADLILMGTRGRTGLERLLLGSVARKVFHHAPCSVLIDRSPAPVQ